MNALRWMIPTYPLSTRELVAFYWTGTHTANGGRTTAQIRAATTARAHVAGTPVASFDQALGLLRAGWVLTVAGDYSRLGTTFARWDLPFARGKGPHDHMITAGPIAAGDVSADPWVWWRDPLNKVGYHGQWARWSMIRGYSLRAADMTAFPHNAGKVAA
jgi:hypothetical protein